MTAILLGEPCPVPADVRIAFRGQGEARFRLQHTVDHQGAPDELCWCDVTRLSDASLQPEAAIDKDGFTRLLVDRVNGDCDLVYRRFRAGWLRVLAGDDDEQALQRCQAYEVSLEPAT